MHEMKAFRRPFNETLSCEKDVIGNGNLTLKNQKSLAIYILSDIIGIRSLSNLNDLDSLNNLSGLNNLYSLISSKKWMSLMVSSTPAPK